MYNHWSSRWSFLLVAVLLPACERPQIVDPPRVCSSTDEQVLYGNGMGVVMGSDFLATGQTQEALLALNDGIQMLRHANATARCGCVRKLCIEYKVIGHYLRAEAYSLLGNVEKAIEDLEWLHQGNWLRHLAPKVKFWDEPKLEALRGQARFQYLVQQYRR